MTKKKNTKYDNYTKEQPITKLVASFLACA